MYASVLKKASMEKKINEELFLQFNLSKHEILAHAFKYHFQDFVLYKKNHVKLSHANACYVAY